MTDSEFQTLFKKRFSVVQKEIKKRSSNISRIMREALEHPTRETIHWTRVRMALDAEYNALLSIFNGWAKEEIPAAYEVFLKDVAKQIKRVGALEDFALRAVTKIETLESTSMLTTALYQDAVASYAAALGAGKEEMYRVTRMTQQKMIEEWMLDRSLAQAIESGNVRNFIDILAKNSPAYRKALDAIDEDGFILVNGRHYDPEYYAELVARTRFHEAQSNATLMTASQYGTDLVKVSSHNTTTELCMEHEGKIYSISGKDKRFPALGATPPFHPNCLHLLYPYFEEALAVDGIK